MEFLPYQQPALYHPVFAPQHQQSHQYPQDAYSYFEVQQRAQVYMPRRSVSFDDLRHAMAAHGEKNETKARLAKDQVEILEAKFQENNKPNSQVKRLLAADFGVEQARINNWFQNRRAKAKQERKQLEHDATKHGDLPYTDDSDSPENYSGDVYEDGFQGLAMGNMAQIPILGGPPSAPVSSFAPRYDNTNSASMNSLQRTLTAAEEALARGDFAAEYQLDSAQFSPNGFPVENRAQFPSTTTPLGFAAPLMQSDSSVVHFGQSNSGLFENSSQVYPSQMLSSSFETPQYQSHAMMPVNSAPTAMATSPDTADASFSLNSIPGPSNIASRRAKQRPANLGLDALRDNTVMGPRSYSSSDIPQRLNTHSPTGSSPMRRVASNQVNLNVISGRVQKVPMPLKSPISKSFGLGCESYLREMPQTARTAFPPTPSSPFDAKHVVHSSASSSPLERDASFIFNSNNFETAEQGSTMASPPETPHNPIVNNHWGYEALDQPLQTPNFEMFPGELHLQMPPFVSPLSASQPNTPAFSAFNGFPMQNTSPALDFGFDNQMEYIFPGDGLAYSQSGSTKSSPMSLQKTFTFNNITQESLKQQQRRTEERDKTPIKLNRM